MVLKSAFRPACVAVVAVAIGLMASPGRAAEKSDCQGNRQGRGEDRRVVRRDGVRRHRSEADSEGLEAIHRVD